jgi:hypothetical protein
VNQVWFTVLVLSLVLMLGLSAGWAIGAGETQAAPASAVPSTVIWAYAPTPDSEMAATQQSYAQLLSRYRQYQKSWRAYQQVLKNCQKSSPSDCVLKVAQGDCGNQQSTQCLSRVITPLETARHQVHDQAIELEWAAQQLAANTE